jgi:hypothetical protein
LHGLAPNFARYKAGAVTGDRASIETDASERWNGGLPNSARPGLQTLRLEFQRGTPSRDTARLGG